MSYLDVYYSQMTLFLLMRPDGELITSWRDGGILWNLEVLELVGQKRSTFIAVSVEGWV